MIIYSALINKDPRSRYALVPSGHFFLPTTTTREDARTPIGVRFTFMEIFNSWLVGVGGSEIHLECDTIRLDSTEETKLDQK